MELRNLHRHFTFIKALNKRNKTALIRLNRSQVATLLTVYRLCKKAQTIGIKAIQIDLMRLGFAGYLENIRKDLNHLFTHQLIDKTPAAGRFETNRYFITMEGINELFDIEQIHRKERIDK